MVNSSPRSQSFPSAPTVVVATIDEISATTPNPSCQSDPKYELPKMLRTITKYVGHLPATRADHHGRHCHAPKPLPLGQLCKVLFGRALLKKEFIEGFREKYQHVEIL
jgi:hypothetical protein